MASWKEQNRKNWLRERIKRGEVQADPKQDLRRPSISDEQLLRRIRDAGERSRIDWNRRTR